MSGLAATRLVKKAAPATTAVAAPEEVLFNAATFLEKKTDHAAYLYKTLFSVVAIAMSQMATLRPQSPFVWLGIYLLRHSGLCHSVKLSDGRTVVCDGSVAAAKPPTEDDKSSSDSESDNDAKLQEPRGNNDTTDEEGHSDNEDEKSWDGKLSASESENEKEPAAESHPKDASSSDSSSDNDHNSNSDDETNEGQQQEAVKAAMAVQASFRGHRARKELQQQQHDDRRAQQLQQQQQQQPRQQFRSYRHGVRIGRTLYHVMASSNGEVQITDSRTMATTTTSCAGEDAANLAAITACVREAMTPEDPDKKKLRSQATCARALDIASTPGTSEQGFHGLAILHFSAPTAVLYDQNSGQVFIASGGNEKHQRGTGVIQDRKRLSKNPDQVLSQLWKQHFAHIGPLRDDGAIDALPGGAVPISTHSDRQAVVALVDSTQQPADEEDDDQSTNSSSSSSSLSSSSDGRACCYVITAQQTSLNPVPRTVPRTVQTNNFTSKANATSRVEAQTTVASPSPRLLPRVIRTAHKFGNGCRVMVEINHRIDPVKVVVFEQRTMTSETFLVDRSQLKLPSSDADDRAWIGAVVRRLRCDGRSPHWTFSLDA